ncbi:MAG: cyanophycinase [Bacillota bacterium]
MGHKVSGNLLIIGGAEDKKNECRILKNFVALAGGPKSIVAVITTATQEPEAVGSQYRQILSRLGAGEVRVLDIVTRDQANNPESTQVIEEATGIFFTGGDQLRITSTIGGTKVNEALSRAYRSGVVIAGTSAGASVMSGTMIVGGSSDDAPKMNTLNMAPGMGLLEEVVIDQHFAQRGRLGRLLAAVAHNPYILGIGIDEDTAVIVDPEARLEVVGSQTVTIIDGRNISHTNVSELQTGQPLAVLGIKLHVIPAGYGFDLKTRLPLPKKAENNKEGDQDADSGD